MLFWSRPLTTHSLLNRHIYPNHEYTMNIFRISATFCIAVERLGMKIYNNAIEICDVVSNNNSTIDLKI